MDKNTLSNYGWIVIAVLVLSVMIALATPFGEYIKAGVESTTAGLFDTSEKALNVVGMSAKEKDVLKGNKIAVFGTSISSGNSTETTYCKVIAKNNEMSLRNYAVGGTNIMYALSVYRDRADDLSSFSENDYVIFEGLLNSVNLTYGEITPVGTTTFNEKTVIGALESLLYEYKNSGCKAKVGFILTHHTESATSNPETMKKYNELWSAAIEVCEKYDIPYINLLNEVFTLQDNVHPDNAGHEKMAGLIEPWLKTL